MDLGVAGTIATQVVDVENINLWLNFNADIEVIDIKVITRKKVLIIYRREG